MTTSKSRKQKILDQIGFLWFLWAIIVWPFALPHPWDQIAFWTQLAITSIGGVLITHKIRKPRRNKNIHATTSQYYDQRGNPTDSPKKGVYSLSRPTHRYDDEREQPLYRDRNPDYPH